MYSRVIFYIGINFCLYFLIGTPRKSMKMLTAYCNLQWKFFHWQTMKRLELYISATTNNGFKLFLLKKEIVCLKYGNVKGFVVYVVYVT